MKHCFLIVFLLIIQLHVFSQKKYPVIREADLKGKALKEWHRIDTTWTKHIFPGCLLENNLKLNCADCDHIYLEVRLTIDSHGRLISHEKTGGTMCEKEISDNVVKCFLDFFYFLEFPRKLRNHNFEVKIGTSLKC